MKIGLVLSAPGQSVSVKHVMASVWDALNGDHELVYLHPRIAFASEEEQHRVAGEFIAACDVVVGRINPAVLAARQRTGRRIPYLVLMLGTMPRGAFRFREHVPLLSTDDVLVVNSEADRTIAERFLSNADVALVPLAYDDRSFRPMDGGERLAIRAELGFSDDARVLLYSGRIFPEKNLHTVLRVFSVLLAEMPNLHLVLAGRIESLPFSEFGVVPTNFAHTLAMAGRQLGIPDERLLCAGPVPPEELREFYSVADVCINLTLHHDENFGLAQVEAMACGSPVVGSMWGGLKDTIVDGSTGYRVSTVATPLGVRVNWWEAAGRVATLLRDSAKAERLGAEGPGYAARNFSQARLRDRLNELLRSRLGAQREAAPEPLRVSDFAQEFWSTCDPDVEVRPPYRRGARSMELYRELITPYTGLSPLGVATAEPLQDDYTLALAVPVVGDARTGYWLDDPLYPLQCEVPARHTRWFRKLLAAFAAEPVITVQRMAERHRARTPEILDALAWMIEMGLVLRSTAIPGGIDPTAVPPRVAQPLFAFQRLPPTGIDFVVSA